MTGARSDRDGLAEAAAIAETLRAAIDSLDERIEERAQQIAAQRHASTTPEIVEEIAEPLQRLGQIMRQEVMERGPDVREFTASISEEAWTASAASLLAGVYADIARTRRQERGDG